MAAAKEEIPADIIGVGEVDAAVSIVPVLSDIKSTFTFVVQPTYYRSGFFNAERDTKLMQESAFRRTARADHRF